MTDGEWLPISANLPFPKYREWSEIEAAFCLQYDHNRGKDVTILGYASLWRWSRNKVVKFIDDMGVEIVYAEKGRNVRGTLKGQIKDIKRTNKGHKRFILFNGLEGGKDIKRTNKGQIKDIKRFTTNDNNNNIKPNTLYSEEFETFWQAYPRGEGKGKAWQSWQKLAPPLNEVLKALQWQKESDQWTKENGQFIPQPTTYLNQRRWEDKPPAKSEKPKQASWL